MASRSTDLRSEEEQALVRRFKQLTEVTLPVLSRQQHWSIHFDHCFKRICLDYAFDDVWYNHLARPAERHLRGEPLRRAVRCAEDLVDQGRSLMELRDAASLRFRGKKPKHSSKLS